MRPKNEPGLPQWRGEALRLRRIASGWSATQLGERVGVSKPTIHRWERNENSPTSEQVRALADALVVDVIVFSKAPRIV